MSLMRIPRIAIFDFYDLRSQAGLGRILADQLAERVMATDQYVLTERRAWSDIVCVESEISQECRFHTAWAVHAGALATADAVVIGKIHGGRDGEAIALSAKLLDIATGETLGDAEFADFDAVARLLSSRRMAGRVRVRGRNIRTQICSVSGNAAIFHAGKASGLLRNDRLRVERILETVSDPYCGQRLGYLASTIGEAKVLNVGRSASLAWYSGKTSPRAGDLCILLDD